MDNRATEAVLPAEAFTPNRPKGDFTGDAAGFGEFFGHDSSESEGFEEFDTSDGYHEADLTLGGNAEAFSDLFPAALSETLPEALSDSQDWIELYDAGIGYRDAARAVFEELAEADDIEIDQALRDWTMDMSPEELEGFWKKLGKVTKRVLSVAAPIVQTAAPIVGTAVGGAFGAAPIGGAIGNLVGSGVGALNQRVNRRGRPAGRRPVGRRVPVGRRRVAKQVRPRMRRRRAVPRRSATGNLSRILNNPQVRQVLSQILSGGIGAIVGRRETMSDSAVLAGIYGGILETLREMEAERGDLDSFEGGYGPADFDSPEEAFETLAALTAGNDG